MTGPAGDGPERELLGRATEVAIRLFLVGGLAIWCFLIFQPFLLPLVWAAVLAVSLGPVLDRLQALLGGRRTLAGVLFVAVGIVALALPATLLSESFVEGVQWLGEQEQKGALRIPAPPDDVAGWPVVGSDLHRIWSQAASDPASLVRGFGPQLGSLAGWLLSTLKGLGLAFLLTLAAIAVAGVMLVHAEPGGRTARRVGARLGGQEGVATVDLTVQTIRSVAAGVIGVAAVQSILAAVGLVAAGVPLAGLWAALILILAVAQLPPLLILGPAIVYVFATSEGTVGPVLFAVWSLVVSLSDSFLKPMFLGRGMEIPMPVILVGAIGGMLQSGVVGLFVGAVVLAIGYRMAGAWMRGR